MVASLLPVSIRIDRRLKAIDVIDVRTCSSCAACASMFAQNGPGSFATAVQEWIGGVGAKTANIGPGSPFGTGFIESFHARLRDELLDAAFSTPSRRQRSSSKAGGGTSTRYARTAPLDPRSLDHPREHRRHEFEVPSCRSNGGQVANLTDLLAVVRS